MKNLLSIAILSIFCFTQCQSQQKPKSMNSEKENTNANAITFKVGETKFLKDYEMNVTFDGVTEDSRCPEGTQCIWSGVAVAKITVMGLYTRPTTLSLASTDMPSKGYQKQADFNGYRFSFDQIAPYPTKSQTSDKLKDQYQLQLTISKIGPADAATFSK